MQGRLTLLLDALALLVAKASFIGLRLVAMYLLAARMGRDEFGLLALAFTIAEIARYIGDWGTDTLSLRVFSQPEVALASRAFRWLCGLRTAVSLLALVLAGGTIAWLCSSLSWPVQLMVALTSSTSLWLNAGVNWLQARQALRPVALVLAVTGALSCLVQGLGAYLGWDVIGRLLALIGFELLMAVTVVALALRHAGPASAAQPPGLRAWFAEATPIAVASLLALMYSRCDQFYVRHFAEAGLLGDYSLAIRLIEPFVFVAAALSSTIYARASSALMADGVTSASRAVALKWLRGMASYGLATMLLVGLVATLALPSLLPAYAAAIGFVWIGLAGLIFRCLNLCLTALLQALGHYQKMMRLSIFNAALVPTLVLAGGHWFGPIGVACAMVLGESINSIIQWRLFRAAYALVATL